MNFGWRVKWYINHNGVKSFLKAYCYLHAPKGGLISEFFSISKKCTKSLSWAPKENMLRIVIWHIFFGNIVTFWDQITSTFSPDIFSILIIWIFWSGKKHSMLRMDFNPLCKNIPVGSSIFETHYHLQVEANSKKIAQKNRCYF